jgi:hypothetical protein
MQATVTEKPAAAAATTPAPIADEAQLAEVRAGADEAQRRAEALREELAEADHRADVLRRVASYIERGLRAHLAVLLREEGQRSQSLMVGGEPLAPLMRQLLKDAEELARTDARQFPKSFERECRNAGLELDRSWRHPIYSVRQFIQVEVDEASLTATVTPRGGSAVVVPIDVSVLVEVIEAEIRRLFDRKVDAQRFLKTLYSAYLAVIRAEGKPEGEEMPLRRVTHRLSKNVARFSADEFAIDLGQVLDSGETLIEGRRLHVNQSRNLRQGLLLPGHETGGYVGQISFRPAADEVVEKPKRARS